MTFPLRLITVLFIVSLLLSACAPSQIIQSSNFVEPDPETYVDLLPLVLEYFHLRKQAVLAGDVNTFYDRYPDLKNNTNVESGINTESTHISNIHAIFPIDGNILPEYYENIRISQSEKDVQVLVHGMELYLRLTSQGEFSESGGEFKLVLFMHQEGKTWQIYKTDEVMLHEWQDFKP